MPLIKNILNGLNHKKDLEEQRDQLIKKIETLQDSVSKLQKTAEDLYQLRKEAYWNIQALETYIRFLPNHPELLEKGIQRAVEYSYSIREAWTYEQTNLNAKIEGEESGSGDSALLGASAIGGAVAIGGPATLMAIATTFGTAGTGTAIWTLGGAAATNAALAWLGGGALAVGGGGIAAGSALLGLLGPIGWSIAGIGMLSVAVSSIFKRKKNDEAILEIYKKTVEVNKIQMSINKMQLRILEITDSTRSLTHSINLSKIDRNEKDFNALTYPRQLLFEMVDRAKTLGKLSQEAVDVNS